MKTYQLQHSIFYEYLQKHDGVRNLAFLIKTTCELLKNIEGIGAMHCNLRVENIALKFNQTEIESIKFLGFGHITDIEQAEELQLDEIFDQIPPDLSR